MRVCELVGCRPKLSNRARLGEGERGRAPLTPRDESGSSLAHPDWLGLGVGDRTPHRSSPEESTKECLHDILFNRRIISGQVSVFDRGEVGTAPPPEKGVVGCGNPNAMRMRAQVMGPTIPSAFRRPFCACQRATDCANRVSFGLELGKPRSRPMSCSYLSHPSMALYRRFERTA